MALNSSGTISLGGSTTGQSVNLELGKSATAIISFNDAAVRTLTGTSSGASLTMPGGFYGKARRIPISYYIGGTYDYNYVANTAKVSGSGYIAGISDVTFILGYSYSQVFGSFSTGSYAFTIDNSWTSGDTVTLIIYSGSQIQGRGGDGGGTAGNGSSGGPAILAQYPVTIVNNGVVGAGGGGGGGAQNFTFKDNTMYGGGGGGGQGWSGGAGGASSARAAGDYSIDGLPGYYDHAGVGRGNDVFKGGNGGTLGSAGSSGGSWSPGYFPNTSGGASNSALIGKSYVNGGAGISGTVYGGQS
jgi:hypothetical protein